MPARHSRVMVSCTGWSDAVRMVIVTRSASPRPVAGSTVTVTGDSWLSAGFVWRGTSTPMALSAARTATTSRRGRFSGFCSTSPARHVSSATTARRLHEAGSGDQERRVVQTKRKVLPPVRGSAPPAAVVLVAGADVDEPGAVTVTPARTDRTAQYLTVGEAAAYLKRRSGSSGD